MSGSLLDALRIVLDPGENIGCLELLRRLNTQAPWFSTAFIGTKLEHLAFRSYRGDWKGSEFVTYRVPTFDHEAEGDWTDGELRIVRRDEATNE